MPYPSISTQARNRARRLRRDQTDAERKLWWRLRARQVQNAKFRRQLPIEPYIVDFCCIEHRLVVELDGGQHTVNAAADRKRAAYLRTRGYRVLRFWDNEVLKDMESVLERIAAALNSPHPDPLPEGEGDTGSGAQ